ncbi:MAG TPA: hypothetical protein PK765_05255 [bacterium]|nr:hypothetical protein [bacterium]
MLSGLSVGHAVRRANHRAYRDKLDLAPESVRTRYFDVIVLGFVAYFWETIEHYLETGLAGSWVEYWFHGVEFWGNRIITDPLLLVAGYLIVRRFPRLVVPARICSVIWLLVHVVIFPHSMYLHEIFS